MHSVSLDPGDVIDFEGFVFLCLCPTFYVNRGLWGLWMSAWYLEAKELTAMRETLQQIYFRIDVHLGHEVREDDRVLHYWSWNGDIEQEEHAFFHWNVETI